MEFNFAQYTEITDYAFKVNPNYKNEGYVRFFICPDVNDFWFVRVLVGSRYDDIEGYVDCDNHYILERNNIPNSKKAENVTLSKLRKIIEEDDGSSWDLKQGYDLEELIDMLDDGFGIINRKEV